MPPYGGQNQNPVLWAGFFILPLVNYLMRSKMKLECDELGQQFSRSHELIVLIYGNCVPW